MSDLDARRGTYNMYWCWRENYWLTAWLDSLETDSPNSITSDFPFSKLKISSSHDKTSLRDYLRSVKDCFVSHRYHLRISVNITVSSACDNLAVTKETNIEMLRKRRCPRILPWGTPVLTGVGSESSTPWNWTVKRIFFANFGRTDSKVICTRMNK